LGSHRRRARCRARHYFLGGLGKYRRRRKDLAAVRASCDCRVVDGWMAISLVVKAFGNASYSGGSYGPAPLLFGGREDISQCRQKRQGAVATASTGAARRRWRGCVAGPPGLLGLRYRRQGDELLGASGRTPTMTRQHSRSSSRRTLKWTRGHQYTKSVPVQVRPASLALVLPGLGEPHGEADRPPEPKNSPRAGRSRRGQARSKGRRP